MRNTMIATLLLVLSMAFLACSGGRDASDSASGGASESVWPDSATVDEVRVGTVRQGSTLQQLLQESGLTAAEALRLSRAVDPVYPVRNLQVGTPYSLIVSPDGRPVRFELWPEPVMGVVAVVDGDTWRADTLERRMDRYVRFITAEIEDNLYASLTAAGADPALVLVVSDILQWDVDFFVDPRPGDRITLIVEEWADAREVVQHGPILALEYEGQKVSAQAYLHRDGEASGYYHPDGTSVRRALLKSPLNYRRISSHFSNRRLHPILRIYRPHHGVDYAAPAGTPVVALGDGTVSFAGRKGGYGRMVSVRHNARLATQYAHFSRMARGIRKGVRVKQGQVIGYVGSTGLSTGPHLDFRCKLNGSFVNPLTLDRPAAEPLPSGAHPAFSHAVDALRGALTRLNRTGFIEWDEFRSHFDPDMKVGALETASRPSG